MDKPLDCIGVSMGNIGKSDTREYRNCPVHGPYAACGYCARCKTVDDMRLSQSNSMGLEND